MGLAPQLLSCDRSTFSDFAIIIVENFARSCVEILVEQLLPIDVVQVSGALSTLHDNGLVFGDLRSPNILLTNRHRVQFVDFDWCGKIGEGEYPSGMNAVDIKWPEGVVPGGLLRFEHDNEMFRRLELGVE